MIKNYENVDQVFFQPAASGLSVGVFTTTAKPTKQKKRWSAISTKEYKVNQARYSPPIPLNSIIISPSSFIKFAIKLEEDGQIRIKSFLLSYPDLYTLSLTLQNIVSYIDQNFKEIFVLNENNELTIPAKHASQDFSIVASGSVNKSTTPKIMTFTITILTNMVNEEEPAIAISFEGAEALLDLDQFYSLTHLLSDFDLLQVTNSHLIMMQNQMLLDRLYTGKRDSTEEKTVSTISRIPPRRKV